ncbi:DUF2829 domain-containing protein [Bacteroides sp. 224]|uniref:DUF2829 domain-containing protein n=1 Tax=Bacteroides sp. 224 TaxID=2302936 RepID=UPI0019403246|nr:DUF2829 domain-containing protein [Bacteroides sp. 224]
MSEVTTLNFGQAIEAMKQGKAVARSGWNGKGMHISLNVGNIDPEIYGFVGMDHPKYPHGSSIDGVDMGLFNLGDAGTTTRLPNIDMVTASGSIVRGWLASQTDILAEDWLIIE